MGQLPPWGSWEGHHVLTMDPIDVARRLRAVSERMDASHAGKGETRLSIAGAWVTVNPASDSPIVSRNRNRVQYFGCTQHVEPCDLDAALDPFVQARVPRCYFWLSPCPQAADIQVWLAERGFVPFTGIPPWPAPDYHTLVYAPEAGPLRGLESGIARRTSLVVRSPSRAEAELHVADLAGIHAAFGGDDIFLASLGCAGFSHFLAFDGPRPVAAAILVTHDGIAYLGYAATAEADRRRGGQSALIEARLRRAAELGCRCAVSETLSILSSSLGNLKRRGFQVLYDKKIFVRSAT